MTSILGITSLALSIVGMFLYTIRHPVATVFAIVFTILTWATIIFLFILMYGGPIYL